LLSFSNPIVNLILLSNILRSLANIDVIALTKNDNKQ
jgi:hypothetical protein